MTAAYLRDPKAIYAESFATIEREADLSAFDADGRALAIRLIHACGMVDITNDLVITEDCLAAGRAALARGAPIFCDATMVQQGIIRRGRLRDTDVVCPLTAPDVAARAEHAGTTRSAAAVELWRPRIESAIVAIGNAPTALFHLLERLADGWPKPACILAFPVGFVGAAESKAALIEANLDIPFATLRGRRGGSALAAAAVNALGLGLDGDGR
ncbi:MAG: precorrin-8X methylmutase [Pseudomonadota bacterium]